MAMKMNIPQQPLINTIQKIVIYETKARFYIVGSNYTQTKFRVLKIDRTEPRDLIINDDENEYSRKEIRELLHMIEMGNQPKSSQKFNSTSSGLKPTISAFGLIGFVRFLEGYYMILITKRRRVALMGPYTIFKVEDTIMLPIPNDNVKYTHSDEQRYVKMFQNVDLSSNFYYTYSYDLTQTLQYNLTKCTNQLNKDDTTIPINTSQILLVEKDSNLANYSQTETADSFCKDVICEDNNDNKDNEENYVIGVRNDPYWKFVWNKYLLDPVINQIKHDWLLFLIHGFIGQSNVCIFGKSVYLTLISRRSNKFAGTRFLKRGTNLEGHVANEVETEQIVFDASTTNFQKIHFTSFVQIRGSMPLHWSQDVSKMVPKPTISIDQSDPYGHIAGQHFNRLFERYGAPITILDLVKRKEHKKHESLISEEFSGVIQYLNKFLPVEHRIIYVGFDMSRANKAKNSNVLNKLLEIAEFCLDKTHFFNSRDITKKQCGIVRTNCVDCLDRTNTAQFAIGKHALALQLHALGIIEFPSLDFDTDCLRILEDLYEDGGDTLALQYGGSQLVHRIKGYRKVSPWTSSSRDIMQSLSRYYSNTFSDNDKQQAINLFLGVFRPVEGRSNIWEMVTDYYLHNHEMITKSAPYTQWFSMDIVKALPMPFLEVCKGLQKMLAYLTLPADDYRVNAYLEYYNPFELSVFEELYVINMPNSIRDFMPKYAESPSAFTRRVWPRKGNESGKGISVATSGILGKDPSTLTGSDSGTSCSDLSDTEASKSEGSLHRLMPIDHYKSFKDLFRKADKIYGEQEFKLNADSRNLYNNFISLGPMQPHPENQHAVRYTEKFEYNNFRNISTDFKLQVPSEYSLSVYQNYLHVGVHGPNPLSPKDLCIFKNYVEMIR